MFDDRHLVFEVTKISTSGLVDKCIAIGKKQNALFGTRLPKSINNLESSVGFSRAGGHGEQEALLIFGNSLNAAINGNLLVITWAATCAVKKVILYGDALGFNSFNAFVTLIALP